MENFDVILKCQGNECFKKGKYNAAVDFYTEAIAFNPKCGSYHTNRAMAYMKLENYPKGINDLQTALEMDPKNYKAFYLLGQCSQMKKQYKESIEYFEKALLYDKTKQEEEIRKELRKSRKLLYEEEEAKRIGDIDQWYQKLYAFLEEGETEGEGSSRRREFLRSPREEKTPQGKTGEEQHLEGGNQVTKKEKLVEHLKEWKKQTLICLDDRHVPIPEAFYCPISMEVMLDPMISPNGRTYERRVIETHLKVNGPVDPITRERLTMEMMYPNATLKAAINEFLDRFPGAYDV